MHPGDELAQGITQDVGQLNPITALMQLLMGIGQQTPPNQSGPGNQISGVGTPQQSLRDRMMMDMRSKSLSAPGGMGY